MILDNHSYLYLFANGARLYCSVCLIKKKDVRELNQPEHKFKLTN